MRKLFPVILALIGIGGGVGAGLFLKPAPEEMAEAIECVPPHDAPEHAKAPPPEPDPDAGEGTNEFVKMSNQFVIPVVSDERVSALVVVSLTLEVEAGKTETIYKFEPKLRDSFLQVLFDHANVGGFEGAFTEANNMAVLRRALFETARNVVGSSVRDVLITEIARQDS